MGNILVLNTKSSHFPLRQILFLLCFEKSVETLNSKYKQALIVLSSFKNCGGSQFGLLASAHSQQGSKLHFRSKFLQIYRGKLKSESVLVDQNIAEDILSGY